MQNNTPDCITPQAKDERKLDFAFNASFTAINAKKIMMKQ